MSGRIDLTLALNLKSKALGVLKPDRFCNAHVFHQILDVARGFSA